MKHFIFASATFICMQQIWAAELNYKLAEALQKKLVTTKINGAKPDTASTSSHRGACMSMEIVSSATVPVNLALDYGYKLEPDDTNVQTMIVTKSMMVKLAPGQKKNCRIYAMCTEASDAGPSETRRFSFGNRANGNLLGVAELINRKNYQNDAAQNAVWCLTDNHDLYSIADDDTTMMYELRRFVAKAKGIPLSKIYEVYEPGAAPQRISRITTTYSGSMSYYSDRPCKILVAIFDEQNHMKKVYVNNEAQRGGEYTYKYQISSEETGNQKMYLRMFRDGKMEQEVSILSRE